MRIALVLVLSFLFLLSCDQVDMTITEDRISIENPEVYELANIILALTDYGLQDNNQVKKNNTYYDKMLKHFEPFQEHEIIDSANFSKERWKEFLSFRTDAFAFEFDDKGKLFRDSEFQAFEIKTFDKYLHLVQDFADRSKFREFYSEHKNFYVSNLEEYRKQYMVHDMQEFLNKEFGNLLGDKNYKVVLSSFVGGQNLHRDIDSLTSADFVDIPNAILYDTITTDRKEISTAIHTLFTEMDHGYINTVSEAYTAEIFSKFNDAIWNDGSGYEEGKNDVFNEYMTWAVFDLFNMHKFPEYADEINRNYHYINSNRGFPFSNVFSEKLREIYSQKRSSETIKDMFPSILDWTNHIERDLSYPKIVSPEKELIIDSFPVERIRFEFSEGMNKNEVFNVIFGMDNGERDLVEIKENIHWNNDGTILSFSLDLEKKQYTSITFNYWGVTLPLISSKGVFLKPTYIRFKK